METTLRTMTRFSRVHVPGKRRRLDDDEGVFHLVKGRDHNHESNVVLEKTKKNKKMEYN